jgi:hypothetical protein
LSTTPGPSPTPTTPSLTPTTATPTTTPTGGWACVTSDQRGECGPWNYPKIQGLTSGNEDKTTVGNNIWSPIPGGTQTLQANNPGDWHITANLHAGNTAVVSYPSLSADYHQQDPSTGAWSGRPLTNFTRMISSFSETMNANSGTSAWAAYDIWLGNSGTADEVMIQHDFADNGACDAVAEAMFGGTNGVPVQPWHLCQFGSELVWKLGTDDTHQVSEQSGSVDILAMLSWLEDHGYIAQGSVLNSIGYGWEISSTGGVNETFQVSSFFITAA